MRKDQTHGAFVTGRKVGPTIDMEEQRKRGFEHLDLSMTDTRSGGILSDPDDVTFSWTDEPGVYALVELGEQPDDEPMQRADWWEVSRLGGTGQMMIMLYSDSGVTYISIDEDRRKTLINALEEL